MVKGSDYPKAIASGETYILKATSIKEAFRILDRWLQKVPFEYMSEEGRKRFERFVVEPLKRFIGEKFIEEKIKVAKERAPRWRPAYSRVAEYLVEHPEELEEISKMRPMAAYRYLAEKLKISWRTVRDAFWALRYGDVEVW